MNLKEKFKARFPKLYNKFGELYSKAVVIRDKALDKTVDTLVNIQPLTDKESVYAKSIVPLFLLIAACINFGLSAVLWVLYFFWIGREIFTKENLPTFSKWWDGYVAYISQPAPVIQSDDVNTILMREANNPNFRALDHPRYGKTIFGFW